MRGPALLLCGSFFTTSVASGQNAPPSAPPVQEPTRAPPGAGGSEPVPAQGAGPHPSPAAEAGAVPASQAAPPAAEPMQPPPPPPPPPPPVIYVATPPPPPARPRLGYHVHDGFYLRMSLGGGYMVSRITHDDSATPDRNLSGGGTAFDLMMGGSPARGLVFGGGLWFQSAPEPDTDSESSSAETYTDLSLVMLGAFVDGFPDPQGGFHVGGALALAAVNAEFKDQDIDPEPDRIGEDKGGTAGFGASAWIGYGGWVSSDWSLGGMLRMSGAVTGSDSDALTQRVATRAFALLFTGLYH